MTYLRGDACENGLEMFKKKEGLDKKGEEKK